MAKSRLDPMYATSLGWQGWLVRSRNESIMIDGVLVDCFGRGPSATRIGVLTCPPRRANWSRCPPLDAYVITHEHEDHFNVPTLSMLDRSIPLIVSDRISSAARCLLKEMSFRVHYAYPSETYSVGQAEVEFFSSDHWKFVQLDEWDTVGFMVRDPAAKVAFFSNVDVRITQQMKEKVDRYVARGYRIFACSAMETMPWEVLREREHVANQHGGARVEVLPGQSFAIRRDGVESTLGTPFLRPSSGKRQAPFALRQANPPAEPLTGRRAVSAGDFPEIRAHLEQLAQFMYGRSVYRRLYSIASRESVGNVNPTFLLVLLNSEGGKKWAFEYDPGSCSFPQLSDVAEEFGEGYLGVVVLWASDFLAMARGEVEPRCLIPVTYEAFSIPDIHFQREVFWILYHPQRFPDRVLRQYRRQLRELPNEIVLPYSNTSTVAKVGSCGTDCVPTSLG